MQRIGQLTFRIPVPFVETFINSDQFPPEDQAWRSRLQALDPRRYAATRNHLNGAVSRISPYLTHGFISLSDAVNEIRQRTSLNQDDKLFAEFGWRSFFHHVWAHKGDAIFQDIRPSLTRVSYTDVLPADVREARTGIPAIDMAVSSLYSSGYLHNHARMWIASYVVHLRHVHWKAGADWMYGHLIDGDLASNHLSWQWVAGTFSTKPYLFNADNVSKYAPAKWHCHKTPLDTSYESLERMAFGESESDRHAFVKLAQYCQQKWPAIEEPRRYSIPPVAILSDLACRIFDGSDVAIGGDRPIEIVHAWSLRASSLVANVDTQVPVRLGVIHLPWHAQWPWSHRRWEFVLKRMGSLCDAIFVGDSGHLGDLLPKNRRYYFAETPSASEIQRALFRVQPQSLISAPLFREPEVFCQSFSRYFRAATGI